MSSPPDEAPGWDAIEAALAAHFGDGEPLHWGANLLPDGNGVYGLSAYRDTTGWLLVTLGLSELFDKISDDPLLSGAGLELTMRLPADPSFDAPPKWALSLLSKLGAYVGGGHRIASGHRMNPGGPITGAADTRLTALAFITDPLLGAIDTPNGTVEFLTVVGITADELARMKATSTAAVLEELATANPLLVTYPDR